MATYKPERIFHVNAQNTPIRLENLESINEGVNTNSKVLSIDESGDIRKISLNNELAGKVSITYINKPEDSIYLASGNESVIWLQLQLTEWIYRFRKMIRLEKLSIL